MIFSLKTLRQFLQIDNQEIENISEKLTNIGLEVESFKKQEDIYKQFIVVEIISFEKHPNADKLNVCQVSNGSEILEIVCGAENVKASMITILAPVGSLIPNGNFLIKSSNIRGVKSNGMLCSANELDIDAKKFNLNSDGIIDIDVVNKENVGKKISEILNLNDTIIEVNITPNKADCTGVFGIARDLSNCGFGKLIMPNQIKHLDFLIKDEKVDQKEIVKKFNENKVINKFLIENNVDNVDFAIMTIEGINCKTESPDWLKSALIGCGLNPKNLIIDITNYTSMVFGKPTHSYDISKISEKIIIDKLKDIQQFITLKDEVVDVPTETIVIKDCEKIISIGGIIGSQNSSIDDSTTSVIFESAFFSPDDIAKAGQKTKIISDARFRFERGVDQKLTIPALLFIAETIKSIFPNATIGQINYLSNFNKKIKKISYNINNFKKLIGIEINKQEIVEILIRSKLTNQNEVNLDDIIEVEVPSYRYDIEDETDITEDILRIYGYDKIINNTKSNNRKIIKKQSNQLSKNHQINSILISEDMVEMTNFSFINFKKFEKYIIKDDNLFLKNPISEEMCYMRPSLIFGLLENLMQQCNNHRVISSKIFESGKIFSGTELFEQKNTIAGLVYGGSSDSHLESGSRNYSFYDAKSIVFKILKEAFNIEYHQIDSEVISQKILLKEKYSINQNLFHPYKSMVIMHNNKLIGVCGQINPYLSEQLFGKSDKEIFAFELITENVITQKSNVQNKKQISVYRNFSLIYNGDLATNKVIDRILSQCEQISNARIIDCYQINEQETSYGFEIEISSDQVLTIEQINNVLFSCIEKLTKEFNAKLRDS